MVDLLLSAAEHVEWMRRQMEEERRRLELQQPSPLTHDEDEVCCVLVCMALSFCHYCSGLGMKL